MKISANVEFYESIPVAGVTDDQILEIEITFECRNMATAVRIMRKMFGNNDEVVDYAYVCIED